MTRPRDTHEPYAFPSHRKAQEAAEADAVVLDPAQPGRLMSAVWGWALHRLGARKWTYGLFPAAYEAVLIYPTGRPPDRAYAVRIHPLGCFVRYPETNPRDVVVGPFGNPLEAAARGVAELVRLLDRCRASYGLYHDALSSVLAAWYPNDGRPTAHAAVPPLARLPQAALGFTGDPPKFGARRLTY